MVSGLSSALLGSFFTKTFHTSHGATMRAKPNRTSKLAERANVMQVATLPATMMGFKHSKDCTSAPTASLASSTHCLAQPHAFGSKVLLLLRL